MTEQQISALLSKDKYSAFLNKNSAVQIDCNITVTEEEGKTTIEVTEVVQMVSAPEETIVQKIKDLLASFTYRMKANAQRSSIDSGAVE